jgi:hypothetical protein
LGGDRKLTVPTSSFKKKLVGHSGLEPETPVLSELTNLLLNQATISI